MGRGDSGDSRPTGNEEAASSCDAKAGSRAPRAKSETRVNTDCPARIQLNFDRRASDAWEGCLGCGIGLQ